MNHKSPMLASNADFDRLTFPKLGSIKLDGVRATVETTGLISREGIAIPNKFCQKMFNAVNRPELLHCDGELIVGHSTAKNVFQATMSGVTKHEGEPDVRFWVFDSRFEPSARFVDRLYRAHKACDGDMVMPVGHILLKNHRDVELFEEDAVAAGYEGIMLRDPMAPYKFGRSTAVEQGLLRVKRFVDAEAEIVGFEELMENTNELTQDNLGRAKRSSKKAGKVGKGVLGSFLARDCKSGVEFGCGAGFTGLQRQLFWDNRDKLLGEFFKFSYQLVGTIDKPRIPVFKGLRSRFDFDPRSK